MKNSSMLSETWICYEIMASNSYRGLTVYVYSPSCFVHFMFGSGFPLAVQLTRISSPRLPITFAGGSSTKNGGSVDTKRI